MDLDCGRLEGFEERFGRKSQVEKVFERKQNGEEMRFSRLKFKLNAFWVISDVRG
jgi:hypothetical protein